MPWFKASQYAAEVVEKDDVTYPCAIPHAFADEVENALPVFWESQYVALVVEKELLAMQVPFTLKQPLVRLRP